MAMEIFKLVGSIMVDTDKANESIQKTDKKAEGLGGRLASGVKTAAKWGAGVASAAATVGKAMISGAKDTAANLDEIDKASKRMGIAAEEYQKLGHAAELCGIDMGTMEKAAKKLAGTDLSLDDALNQIMALGTEEERTAAASELFGESVAYNMGPLLQEGGDAFNAMKQEAIDLGLVMSNDSVAAGAAMNDSFTKIEGAVESLKNGLMADFMPYIQQALDWVVQNIPAIRETVTSVIESIKPVVESLIPLVEQVFKMISALWEGGLKKTLTGIIDFVTGVFTGDWGKAWEGVKSIFSGVFEALVTVFKAPINTIISGLNSFIDGVNNIKIPDWVPGVGGKSLHINHISMLERGGVLERGQTGFLEGNGAEAVVPLEKNKKWISALANDMEGVGIGNGKEALSVLHDIRDGIESLKAMGVYLDTGAMVGGLAEPMDKKLGRIAAQKARA